MIAASAFAVSPRVSAKMIWYVSATPTTTGGPTSRRVGLERRRAHRPALLLGSLFSTEQQAGPVAFTLGLGVADFGGSMVPLEVFPDTVRTIAHLTPHAWGDDALSTLLKHDGTLSDVAPRLGVLLAFATGLLVLAVLCFRRGLTAQ